MTSSPAGVTSWSGGCQCGAVRYTIGAELNVIVCHCRMCQKAVGGPFAVLAGAPGGAVVWTRGAPARFRSSDIAERLFCSACGTPLAFADLEDGGLEMTVGSLDEPIKAPPVGAAGLESYLSWIEQVPRLPGRTTAATVSAAGRSSPISYQHPDSNTPEDWAAPKRGSTG